MRSRFSCNLGISGDLAFNSHDVNRNRQNRTRHSRARRVAVASAQGGDGRHARRLRGLGSFSRSRITRRHDDARRRGARGATVTATVGFPHGTNKPTLKAIEATSCIKDAADAVLIVAHLPHLIRGDFDATQPNCWRLCGPRDRLGATRAFMS